MKKLFLTSALVIAAASSAHAVDAPSLGDRLKDNWESNTSRGSWMAPVKHDAAFPGAANATDSGINANSSADDRVKARDNHNNGGHHHHNSNMTPEQKAAKKAEWDKMTPEQKAAKKAEHKANHAAHADNADHKAAAAKATPEEKAKMKADRKAKWDAMTPEQKAAWKAKHAAKKAAAAPVANTTTATPAAAQ